MIAETDYRWREKDQHSSTIFKLPWQIRSGEEWTKNFDESRRANIRNGQRVDCADENEWA
jgi:hypothetical protein